jgi:hypothetical protein
MPSCAATALALASLSPVSISRRRDGACCLSAATAAGLDARTSSWNRNTCTWDCVSYASVKETRRPALDPVLHDAQREASGSCCILIDLDMPVTIAATGSSKFNRGFNRVLVMHRRGPTVAAAPSIASTASTYARKPSGRCVSFSFDFAVVRLSTRRSYGRVRRAAEGARSRPRREMPNLADRFGLFLCHSLLLALAFHPPGWGLVSDSGTMACLELLW